MHLVARETLPEPNSQGNLLLSFQETLSEAENAPDFSHSDFIGWNILKLKG